MVRTTDQNEDKTSKLFEMKSHTSDAFPAPWCANDSHWKVVTPGMDQVTASPSRGITDLLRDTKPNPLVAPLHLMSGNPTLQPPQKAIDALKKSLNSGMNHGYCPPGGMLQAREVIAAMVSKTSTSPIGPADVIITNGVSFGFEVVLRAFVKQGQNVLLPNPGYPLYAGIMKGEGMIARPYTISLNAHGTVLDLENLEANIDNKTAAIVVTNPLNPCGTMFSRLELEGVLKIAGKYGIPVISDEIYGGMVFKPATSNMVANTEFFPMASLDPRVPLITLDGISKRYLLPGWRIGWILIHDYQNALQNIRAPLKTLAARLNGACTVAQAALPELLENVPQSFHLGLNHSLGENAQLVMDKLGKEPGLTPVPPSAAMYIVILIDLSKFRQFTNDVGFTQSLISEQSLYCCPGTMFYCEGTRSENQAPFIRLVLVHPYSVISAACERIKKFCVENYREPFVNTCYI